MSIDITFAIVMLLALFKGWSRGLVVAVFSLLALLLGAAAALKLSAVTAVYWQEHFQSGFLEGRWAPVAAFVLVFLVVVLLVRLGARLIESLLKLALLSWANRLAGALFYVLIYAVLYSIVLWFCNQLNLLGPGLKANSTVYRLLAPLAPHVMDWIGAMIPWFKDMFRVLEEFFGEMAARLYQT
ncbi:CvpA family protein [Compostibacter hankyongensis]|uniref:CvpA family protein n=1 Tax=Compostibacter hankyongensis TaxID=1007089 RepID=A0ABP8FTB0_9BACT